MAFKRLMGVSHKGGLQQRNPPSGNSTPQSTDSTASPNRLSHIKSHPIIGRQSYF